MKLSYKDYLKFDNTPTKRQLEIISEIEDFIGVEFKGTTKDEANEFIEEYYAYYQLEVEWAYAGIIASIEDAGDRE